MKHTEKKFIIAVLLISFILQPSFGQRPGVDPLSDMNEHMQAVFNDSAHCKELAYSEQAGDTYASGICKTYTRCTIETLMCPNDRTVIDSIKGDCTYNFPYTIYDPDGNIEYEGCAKYKYQWVCSYSCRVPIPPNDSSYHIQNPLTTGGSEIITPNGIHGMHGLGLLIGSQAIQIRNKMGNSSNEGALEKWKGKKSVVSVGTPGGADARISIFTVETIGNAGFTVFNSFGQTVHNQALPALAPGHHEFAIQQSNLPNGTHLIMTNLDGQVETHKWVKAH